MAIQTYLGKVRFQNNAIPSIEQILDEAHKNTLLKLEFVESHKNQYCIRFTESPGWCSEIKIRPGFIQVGDDTGTYEGPAVSQLILHSLKKMGGKGNKNDPSITFPLTKIGLDSYEEQYLKNRRLMPRTLKFSSIGIVILIFVYSIINYF
jgi:hypothetical protein